MGHPPVVPLCPSGDHTTVTGGFKGGPRISTYQQSYLQLLLILLFAEAPTLVVLKLVALQRWDWVQLPGSVEVYWNEVMALTRDNGTGQRLMTQKKERESPAGEQVPV